MNAARHSPVIAFLVGVLGIALFSAMDAVMKGLVLAIGTYATMFWRNLAGIGLSGALYLPRRQRWPDALDDEDPPRPRRAVDLHGLPVLLGDRPRAAGAGDRARLHRAADRALPRLAAAARRRSAPRTIGASLVAFAGVLVIFVRPGAGRPWPRSADRKPRDPRFGSALCAQHHHHAAAGAGRQAARDRLLPERDRHA